MSDSSIVAPSDQTHLIPTYLYVLTEGEKEILNNIIRLPKWKRDLLIVAINAATESNIPLLETCRNVAPENWKQELGKLIEQCGGAA